MRMNLRAFSHDLNRFLFVGAVGLLISALPAHAQSLSLRNLQLHESGSRRENTAMFGAIHRIEFGRQLPDPRRARHLRNRCRPLAGPFHVQESRQSPPGWSKEIIFEFVSGGKKSKITYRENYQRPPGWDSI